MKLMNIALSALLLSTLVGHALADEIATCPPKASIKPEEPWGPWDIFYAPGPHKGVWVGENPFGDENLLKKLHFTGALYRDVSSEGNAYVVSCDYEGEGWFDFLRMTLYSFKGWAPVPGTKWVDESKTDESKAKAGAYKKAKEVQYCYADSTEQHPEKQCAFTYKELVLPPKHH
jgi:hypothetical protein